MTTPHVTELPRRLEPICSDPFLGEARDLKPAPPRPLSVARDAHPPGVVVPFRPRDPLASGRPRKRRVPRRPGFSGSTGPGGDAA